MTIAFIIGMLTMGFLLPIVMVWLRSRLAQLESATRLAWEEALARGLVHWEED